MTGGRGILTKTSTGFSTSGKEMPLKKKLNDARDEVSYSLIRDSTSR